MTLKSKARECLPEDKRKELEGHDHNLLGAEEEEKLYNNLRVALAGVTNTIVINGWKDNGSKERRMREFDFLIVSESLNSIIHIEAKRCNSKSSREKAAKQLKQGLDFVLENLPLPGNQGWKYTRVIYFGSGKEDQSPSVNPHNFCPKCYLFVLDSKTNLNEWWLNISKKLETSTQINQTGTDLVSYEVKRGAHVYPTQTTSTYILMCKFLLHQMFQQGQCVTQNDIITHTEETSDAIFRPKNIIFWSKDQFLLLNNAQNKRAFFISPFGTGKTTLIKAKAKELLESGQKVAFVFFEDADMSQESLLQRTYQIEFPGATYVNLKGSGKDAFKKYIFKHFLT